MGLIMGTKDGNGFGGPKPFIYEGQRKQGYCAAGADGNGRTPDHRRGYGLVGDVKGDSSSPWAMGYGCGLWEPD